MNTIDFSINYNTSIVDDYTSTTHSHITHEIIFVADGEATFEIENTTYNLKKHSLLLISNFEKHKCSSCSQNYQRYCCLFGNSFFDTKLFDQTLLSVFMNRNPNFSHLINIPDELVSRIETIFSCLYMEANNNYSLKSHMIKLKINELLLLINRISPENFSDFSTQTNKKIILSIQQYINFNFCKNVTLEELSKLFYLDAHYISLKFKELTGKSFKQYLINLRLTQAKQYLIDTNYSVSEICFNCGFNDISNFLKIFKKHENISPLQYRIKFSNHTHND